MLREHLAELFRLSIGSLFVALKTQLDKTATTTTTKQSRKSKKCNQFVEVTNRNHEDVSRRSLNTQIAIQSVTAGLTLLSTRTHRAWRSSITSRTWWSRQVKIAAIASLYTYTITRSFILLSIKLLHIHHRVNIIHKL